jgi:histidine triad (HIT) family protein
MAEECIFCKIVRKDANSYSVYEDEKAMAFLDIRPVNMGHTLVVPKEHFESIHDIPSGLLQHVHAVVKKIADAQRKAFSPGGISVSQNNGRPAGQIVFHLHAHVIPKDREHHERSEPGGEELAKIAEQLRKALEES